MIHNFATIAARLFLALLFVGTTTADVIRPFPDPDVIPSANRRLRPAECTCSPRKLTFRLNFNGNCEVNTIQDKIGEGVSETDCQIATQNQSLKGTAPAEISRAQIIESNSNLDVLKVKNIERSMNDGDTFKYESISAQLDHDELLGDQEVPSSLLIFLNGENAAGKKFMYALSWTYDLTHCDSEPIITGDAIGLIEVEEYTPAIPAFCAAAAAAVESTVSSTIASTTTTPESPSLVHKKDTTKTKIQPNAKAPKAD